MLAANDLSPFNLLLDMGGTVVRLRDTLSTPRLLRPFRSHKLSRVLSNFLMSSQVHFETTSPSAICRCPPYASIVNQGVSLRKSGSPAKSNRTKTATEAVEGWSLRARISRITAHGSFSGHLVDGHTSLDCGYRAHRDSPRGSVVGALCPSRTKRGTRRTSSGGDGEAT